MEPSKKLVKAWDQRMELRARAVLLRAQSDELRVQCVQDALPSARSALLYAKGSKFYAEGDLIFIKAVISEFGDIGLEWKNWNDKKQSYEYYLDNGMVFKP